MNPPAPIGHTARYTDAELTALLEGGAIGGMLSTAKELCPELRLSQEDLAHFAALMRPQLDAYITRLRPATNAAVAATQAAAAEACDGPEFGDGTDAEGFPGGDARMGIALAPPPAPYAPKTPVLPRTVGYEITWNADVRYIGPRRIVSKDPCNAEDGTARPLTYVDAIQAPAYDLDLLAERFAFWTLPKSVCADPCASMPNVPYLRAGTSLLTVHEARQMLDYLLKPQPAKTPDEQSAVTFYLSNPTAALADLKTRLERSAKQHPVESGDVWSFDDESIGVTDDARRSLRLRIIPRPPGFTTNAQWYHYAGFVRDALRNLVPLTKATP